VEGSEGPLICQMGVSGRYRVVCKPAGCGEAEALRAFSREGGGCSLLCFTHCKWKVTLHFAYVGHQRALPYTRERERERELCTLYTLKNKVFSASGS